MASPLENLSPLDGRYAYKVKELNQYFSEVALFRYRLLIEIEHLIALSKNSKIKEVKQFSSVKENKLRALYKKFDLKSAQRIKEIEKTTHHDVKAIEYYLKEKIQKTSLESIQEFIHFALTSEDTNNLAYTLMFKKAIENEYLPILEKLFKQLFKLVMQNKKVAMLSMTHGQPATPTTLGKEIAVYIYRLNNQKVKLEKHKYLGKLGGCVGNWAAHQIAYPQIDWLSFSQRFIKSLGLEFNPLTTQIENHDSLVEAYDIIKHLNNILINLCQDFWFYISRGLFWQKKRPGEVGSSTMPHKINPIYFENAEGNLGLANSFFKFFADKLTKSRMQRDLSDSTVIRNQGLALGYSYLAIKSIIEGLSRLKVNKQSIKDELDQHWEVLAEAVQTILRKNKIEKSYEKIKDLVRGQTLNKQQYQSFIKLLELAKKDKQILLKLTPEKYVGLSEKLVKFIQ